MNRKDFKSAYDKITLSDECRAEMKNKLMAAMEQKNSSGEFSRKNWLHFSCRRAACRTQGSSRAGRRPMMGVSSCSSWSR